MPDKENELYNEVALSFTTKLLDALASPQSRLQQIIDIGYEALNNPIIVTGTGWKIITMTEQDMLPEDMEWSDFATHGMLSPDSVNMNIMTKLAERIEHSDAPFCWHGQNMKYRRIFGRIMVGGNFTAALSVVEYNRSFTDQDYRIVSTLCRAVSAELQKNPNTRHARYLFREEFITNLLDGTVMSSAAIAEQATALNLGIKKYIYVISLNIKEFEDPNYLFSYICERLERMIPGSNAIVHGDEIVLIATYSEIGERFAADLDFVGKLAKKFGIHCGVSRCITDLTDLALAYRQSIEAIRLGIYMERSGLICKYSDYSIYHIARLCSERTELDTLCHPKVWELLEYDKEHNTFFTESLYVYLMCGRSAPAAAKKLHFHRNTMYYHLHRIEEILDIDLNDNSLLFSLEFSLKFMEYNKSIDTKKYFEDTEAETDQ